MKLSGRNKLSGTVASVETDGLMAKVVVDLGGNNQVTSIITSEAAEDLGLKVGKSIKAHIKATSVMIIDDSQA